MNEFISLTELIMFTTMIFGVISCISGIVVCVIAVVTFFSNKKK